MIKDISRLNDIEDKKDQALEYFSYLTRSQLFIDGNKRLAQLISNKVLMENDLGILAIPVEKRIDFTKILVDYYESNDNTELKDFLSGECIQYAHPEELKEEDDYELE